MPNISELIQFLDYMALKGLPIVAGSLFILMCLWGLFQLISHILGIVAVGREWLPKWFESQVALNEVYRIGIASNSAVLGEIKKDTSQLLEMEMESQGEQQRILRKEAARGVS